MAAFGGNESCPNCGARMAADQRYCLNCGHRRGEPRLPFMDAVTFMESMNKPGGAAGTPPPPPPAEPRSNRMNANAALIAGVATLVLAIGVGFLIGRSGHENSGNAQAQAPIKVIEVGGGGGEPTEATPEETTGGAGETGKSKGTNAGKSAGKPPAKKKASEVKEGSSEEKKRAEEKTKEVLHSSVPTLESGAQLGEKCDPGVAGCSASGEVNGEFFE
jgi:zinc ribbon protein